MLGVAKRLLSVKIGDHADVGSHNTAAACRVGELAAHRSSFAPSQRSASRFEGPAEITEKTLV